MFDSSLRHQVSKENPAIYSIAGFFLWPRIVVTLTSPKKAPACEGRGWSVIGTHPSGHVPNTRLCLLGGFGSCCGSSRCCLGCCRSGGRCRSCFCSSGSGLDGRSGRCCRSGRSGGRCGRGSRCRLFLLATGSQGGSSDQGSDDEGLVHFRFSLRRVKKTKIRNFD